MRVALSVDAIEPQLTGIGRYSLELARGLKKTPEISSLRFFRGIEPIADPEALLSAAVLPPPRPWARWWKRRRDASAIAGMKSSIVHAPNFFLPDWAEGGVATIHDLSVFRFPETHPKARLDDFEHRFERTLARAAQIITGTEAMRSELVAMLGVDADRIAVVPHGVHRATRPTDEQLARQLREVGLTRDNYSLCVATLEPRKRIGQLLEAYALLPLPVRQRWPLMLVGKHGWLAEGIIDQLERAAAEGWARWLGFASPQLLDSLYAGARLFIYPSLYEGFGLPPVEAMAHDVPTLISDDASLVEVSGEAAMVVEADDTVAFAQSIGFALEDEAWRRQAVARGREVARRLAWDQTIRRTTDVYRLLSSG